MDCKLLEGPSSRKNPLKSSVSNGLPEGKFSNSSTSSNSIANNTNPIACAVCGSKEYVTLNSPEKSQYAYQQNSGWSYYDFIKKNSISPEYASSACGPLNPLTQAIFPQMSLLHLPSNIYYSHYNSNFRFPSSPCVPIEKYFGGSNIEFHNSSKAANINSESTMYQNKREMGKKKRNPARIQRSPRGDESITYKSVKEDSRPTSAFTNSSEVRNYPFSMHPPWVGNVCPVFPYTYASWAFPLNQPLIPIYLPVPGKWHGIETRNEEDNMDSSVSNSPMEDAISMKNDGDKASEQKDENSASEYDFELYARELMLEQKSNYDEVEDDEVEINLDEITSSLKIEDTNSGREINSEKFFNSKEKWISSAKEGSHEKSKTQNWNLTSDINMQDCCIRTFNNENLWYEAQDGEKKIRDYSKECNSNFDSKSKHILIEKDERKGDKDKVGDGVFYEANTVWCQDRSRTPSETESKTRSNWRKSSEKSHRRQTTAFGESSDSISTSKDKRNELSKFSKAELNDEMTFSDDKISSMPDSSRLADLKAESYQASKLDIRFNDLTEDTDRTTQTTNQCENMDFKEDNYLVRMHSIEIEYSVNSFDDMKNHGEEDKSCASRKKPLRLQKENTMHDPRQFNWDKINTLLEKYNAKFTEIDVVLKNKQVLGAKMAEAFSGLDYNEQRNSISDSSKPMLSNHETRHGEKLRKVDCKSNGITQPASPQSIKSYSKTKKDEKLKSFGFTNSKYESLKIPIPNVKKGKKPEEIKKR